MASERVHDDIVCSTTPHNMRVYSTVFSPIFHPNSYMEAALVGSIRLSGVERGEINPLIETVNGSKLLSKLF